MEYSNDKEDVYKNIEDYNTNKKRKILIIFDDMIADIINNKNLEVENLIFTLFLLLIHTSFIYSYKCQKMLD